MRGEEKKRNFHEALLNTLYPQSPQTQQQHTNDEPVSPSFESINVDLIPGPDDYGLRLQQSEDENENDDGETKLSRSQRKRIRKKRIKEDINRRRNIIGPLLNSANDGQEGYSDVRRNACDEEVSRNKQNKMKQRREAKKLAKDNKLKTSFSVNSSVHDQLLEPCDKLESFKDLKTNNQDRDFKSEE